jgi:hypothetical protein
MSVRDKPMAKSADDIGLSRTDQAGRATQSEQAITEY